MTILRQFSNGFDVLYSGADSSWIGGGLCLASNGTTLPGGYIQRNRTWDKFVSIKILVTLLISSLKYCSSIHFYSQFMTGTVFLKLSPIVSFVKHFNLLSDEWIVTSCCFLLVSLFSSEVQQIFSYLLDICLFSCEFNFLAFVYF